MLTIYTQSIDGKRGNRKGDSRTLSCSLSTGGLAARGPASVWRLVLPCSPGPRSAVLTRVRLLHVAEGFVQRERPDLRREQDRRSALELELPPTEP